MIDFARFLLFDFIDRIERLFFRLSLHRREKKINSRFDRHLSQEMDCLQCLIDGGKSQK